MVGVEEKEGKESEWKEVFEFFFLLPLLFLHRRRRRRLFSHARIPLPRSLFAAFLRLFRFPSASDDESTRVSHLPCRAFS